MIIVMMIIKTVRVKNKLNEKIIINEWEFKSCYINK